MRVIRLSAPFGDNDLKSEQIFLSDEEAHHAVTVLRLNKGAAVELTGPNGLASATVLDLGVKNKRPWLSLKITGPWLKGPQLPPGPRLALPLIQNQRFDWVLEKAVELGASELLPLITARTNLARCAPNLNRQNRWGRLAEEARKQCGRPLPLTISPPIRFSDLLNLKPPGVFLSLSGPSRCPLPNDSASPLIIVGPEGGLTPKEEETLVAAEFNPWNLGPITLRAETAALAALARLL
ncbi:MAG: RsmE family RNA methyltransferase [Candidatus Adiutrix sp.]